YLTWCKSNNFLSMLAEDTSARRVEEEENAKKALRQTQVNFPIAEKAEVEEPVQPYSDALFREAAIQWLVETNQPIACVEHPSFKKMIDVAARATKGVNIPTRKKTHDAIIQEFKEQMNALSERLNVRVLIFFFFSSC
ncbi:hypothetical protein CPC08DRAFT_646011, partial [Agrocybe pediades]